MTSEAEAASQADPHAPPLLPWARASLGDLEGFDFEAPVADLPSADSPELGDRFRAAAQPGGDEATADTAASRVFHMLAGVTGMMLRSQDPNEPFGPMAALSDGRRSAAPPDFRGQPLAALAEMAVRARHPVLRARLADTCWLLDRTKGQMAGAAAEAYVETVQKVDKGALKFGFEDGALSHSARDLLRRALLIGRAIGTDKPGPSAARDLVSDLRKRAVHQRLSVPTLWFGQLDLDFSVSDPHDVGKDVEGMIDGVPGDTDPHTKVELWRLAARAYHFAKSTQDCHRCQSAGAEQLIAMAEQPTAMMASHFLAAAIAELHGIPGQKERRKALRHRLIEVQAGIADEMSPFFHPMDLQDIAKHTEQQMTRHPLLRDKLFAFALLARSPDPARLVEDAEKSIREHPLSSLFGASHHDSEGKVVHRSEGSGVGDSSDRSAVERQIAEHERIRHYITAAGTIEVARQAIARDHYLCEEAFMHFLAHSPFVPRDVLMTYARGLTRFFQGDFTSALYILTPLLENSLRHVLKSQGHEVTKFDDARSTQEDRTISSMFTEMRSELVGVFGDAIVTDIENVFLKKPGPYLRHRLAHGLLHDGAPYSEDALYGCWLIFHLCTVPLFAYCTQLKLPHDEGESGAQGIAEHEAAE
jgi:hypothetical protein